MVESFFFNDIKTKSKKLTPHISIVLGYDEIEEVPSWPSFGQRLPQPNTILTCIKSIFSGNNYPTHKC